MPKSKKRKGAKKYQAPATYEQARELKLKPRLLVEYESFYTIDSLILRLRDKGWLEECQGAYFFRDEKNEEIDLVHGLRQWKVQWEQVGRHADIDYDDTPLTKLINKLENGSMIFDGDVDALEGLIYVQRDLYRKVPNDVIQKGLDDFNALEAAARLAA